MTQAEIGNHALPRIMMIDDEVSNLQIVKIILMRENYQSELLLYDNGRDALDYLRGHPVDLILLDLLLPDVDGIEVLKTIRGTNNTSTIVVVTGHGGIRSAIAAVQMGADGYIEKQDITSTVRDHIEFLYALAQAIDHRAGLVAQGQLEKIRADFYSMITHDLRNPSSVILTSARMLADDPDEPLTANQRNMILIIDRAAQQLLTLINDYLDFAKIDAGYAAAERGELMDAQQARAQMEQKKHAWLDEQRKA